jgi:hypothetical protein
MKPPRGGKAYVQAVRTSAGRLCATAALLGALCPAPSRADDTRYQEFPIGTRAMALGGAFVAFGDDPSGLTYNPAGICDSRQLNVSVSASLYGLERQGQGSINVDKTTFSLATLATLNVIPGEAGLVKSYGKLDDVGAPFAIGFDVSVPSFRSYGLDTTAPTRLHTRVVDRTFDAAAGAAFRVDERLNLGLGLHFVLRLFSQTEDALTMSGASDPKVGTYHAEGAFANANLVLMAGAKLHLDDGWLAGLALGLPGIPIWSNGTVTIQDVVSDPNATPHTTVNFVDLGNVTSHTTVPLLVRAGAAKVKDHQWTLSGQLTFHAGASYDRFELPADVVSRLRLQTHVERSPVLDVNLGGEYLLGRDWSVALGAFTDFSTAPALQTNADGSLKVGSSRLANVNLYGGTATLGMIGRHAISRLGVSLAYGSGEDAVPNDPSGVVDSTGYSRASVRQLFLYVFLTSTFRY